MGGRGSGTGSVTNEDALRWIVGYFADNGYWPTFAELAAGLNLSGRSGGAYIMQKLRRAGWATAGTGEETTARTMFVAGLSPLLRETALNWLKELKIKGERDGEVQD